MAVSFYHNFVPEDGHGDAVCLLPIFNPYGIFFVCCCILFAVVRSPLRMQLHQFESAFQYNHLLNCHSKENPDKSLYLSGFFYVKKLLFV
jgi:hypothetical protein